MTKQAHSTYNQQQLNTASPVKVVAMLYDKAIACLKEAIEANDANDPERRWKANTRAQEIILQLHSMLDMEQGGIISENLNKIYSTALMRLPLVDVQKSSAIAQEVINMLSPLRDSWHELNQQIAAGKINPAEEMAKAAAEQSGTKQVQVKQEKTSGNYKPAPSHPTSGADQRTSFMTTA